MVNGAKVWIIVSGGFSIQPGEFARLALAVFFAGYLVAKRDVLALAGRRVLGIDLPRARDLGPVLIAWAASLLILIFETDIGTSALFFGLFIVMLYIATQRTSWLLIGVLPVPRRHLPDSAAVPPRDAALHRLAAPVPAAIRSDAAYPAGPGPGGHGLRRPLRHRPRPRPAVSTPRWCRATSSSRRSARSSAWSASWRCCWSSACSSSAGCGRPSRSRTRSRSCWWAGLSFVLALQVFVIVGGVSGLIPLTGITTPFLSQGGSSLVASWMLIALLIRVSDSARKPAPQPIQDEGMTQVVRAA